MVSDDSTDELPACLGKCLFGYAGWDIVVRYVLLSFSFRFEFV